MLRMEFFTKQAKALCSVVCAFGIASAALGAEDADNNFDLGRVIDTAMHSSFQVIRASEEKNAAKAGVKEALSAYYPQIGLTAEYQHLTFVPTITLGTLSMPFGTANSFDAHAGVQMKIYDFGKTATSVASSRIKDDMAGDSADLTRQNLAFESIRIFYSIILLEKSLEAQDAELNDLEQNRKLMQNRARAGSATRYDVVNADVRIALSKSRRIDIENSLATQKIQLNRLLGRDEKMPLRITGQLGFTKVTADETALLDQGSDRRIEIRIAVKNRDWAQSQLQHAQSALAPDLYAGGTAGYRNGYPLDFDKLYANSAFGVKIDAPLFNGFRDMARIDKQNAELKAATANLNDVRAAVRADVLQAIKTVRSGEEKINAADAQVEQAKDAVRRARALYNAGSITARDMLDARTTLLQVELMRLQSLYAFTVADFNLRRAAGEKLWNLR